MSELSRRSHLLVPIPPPSRDVVVSPAAPNIFRWRQEAHGRGQDVMGRAVGTTEQDRKAVEKNSEPQ